jgi:hypothetical protein
MKKSLVILSIVTLMVSGFFTLKETSEQAGHGETFTPTKF